jgi:hypothetical protein
MINVAVNTYNPPPPLVPRWDTKRAHKPTNEQNTVEPGYNDIGLCDISSITSAILWYQLIPHFTLLLYTNNIAVVISTKEPLKMSLI